VGQVALRVYTELETLYLQTEKPAAIISQWAAGMDTIGRRVKVQSGNSAIEGVAESINGSGHLVLRLDDGSTQEILAGDVLPIPGSG
jgi:biotin-(acetyl-CoA carboxylase) ligase